MNNIETGIETVDTALTAHVADTANPHGTTAAQVGAPTIAEFTSATIGSKIYAYKNIGGF